jgi:hypothetical protein
MSKGREMYAFGYVLAYVIYTLKRMRYIALRQCDIFAKSKCCGGERLECHIPPLCHPEHSKALQCISGKESEES